MMIYGAAFMVVFSVLLMAWVLFARPDAAVANTRANLLRGIDTAPTARTGSSFGPGAGMVGLLTPRGTAQRLQKLLARAGHPVDWPLSRVVAAKVVLAAIALGLGLLYYLSTPGVLAVILLVALVPIAYVVPDLLLYSRGQERHQAIQLDLADTLDQMTIAVEAGLGFESAIARAGRNGKGPLAEELVRTLQDISLGQPRRDAYLALAERTDVQDLGRFIRAVLQADAYGVSIADVLRVQSQEMRLKRRQRAEEKAMKIPVKVIFPLILFILPTLFIVLLGPAAMDIVAALSD
jgi:tight adherence protein C